MRRWKEPSIDEMLADPMIEDLMAADRVVPDQLKALLRSLRRPADKPPLRFLDRFNIGCVPGTQPKAVDREWPTIARTASAVADYSRSSIPGATSSMAAKGDEAPGAGQ